MREFNDQQTVGPALRWSKCLRSIILPVVLVFGFFCLLGAIVLLVLMFYYIMPCPSNDDDPKSAQCKRSSKPNKQGGPFGGVAVILIIIGGIMIIVGHKNMKRLKSVQVVVSEIPAQDLEKTPAASSFNSGQDRIPRHVPASFVTDSHSIDLPDYFTIVQQSSEDVYPSVDVAFWTAADDRDVSDDENPPPCYEQALKISGLLTTTNDVEAQLEQGRCEDTRL